MKVGFLLLIDHAELEGRGFEPWRLLVPRFNPSGGAYELDSMMALMAMQPVKDLASLPGAVARFERDFPRRGPAGHSQKNGRFQPSYDFCPNRTPPI